jgi:hypothetical protein
MLVFGYELDLSVNDEIEKKYDSNKLNQDMNTSAATNKKSSKSTTLSNKAVPKSTPVFDLTSIPLVTKIQNTVNKTASNLGMKLPSGTTFDVKSSIKLTDWSGVNTPITFTSINPVTKKLLTVPAGTTFKGKVALAHHGQLTGNGALIEIDITSMTLNGKTYPIEAKVTKVNSKNIFLNKIKGQRQYITGVKNKVQSGVAFYKKSRQISNKLSSTAIGTIVSPLPTIAGLVGATASTVVSPITGLVQKGSGITIPANSEFEIKLTKDVYLN